MPGDGASVPLTSSRVLVTGGAGLIRSRRAAAPIAAGSHGRASPVCNGMHPPFATTRRRARCIGVAVLAAAAALGCRPGSGAETRRPNLLLISIDALRADRLEAYGYERPTSPFLEELGRRGLVYENAFVNTHGTTPSHTTILSGLYQQTHGVGLAAEAADSSSSPVTPPGGRPRTGGAQGIHDVAGLGGGAGGVVSSRIPDTVELVPEILRAAGYTTIGVTGGGNAGAAFGFARGFDHFDDRGGGIEKGSRRVVRLVSEAGAGAPLFVFFHTYDVHSPYRPPPEQRALLGVPDDAPAATSAFLLEHATTAATTLTAAQLDAISRLYDAEIRAADDALRRLFAELEAQGFLRDAVVIVTADHGEELGEHGGLLHRDLLYDELLGVPLIVAGRGVDPGRPVEPVSSIDIAPTLLELAAAPAPAAMEGMSLLRPSAGRGGRGPGGGTEHRGQRGERAAERVGAEEATSATSGARRRAAVIAQYGDARYAIRTREWKLIWSKPGTLELYDLGADPGERENVASLHPEVATTLGAALERWKERHRGAGHDGQPVELTPADWRELESLGYVR